MYHLTEFFSLKRIMTTICEYILEIILDIKTNTHTNSRSINNNILLNPALINIF